MLEDGQVDKTYKYIKQSFYEHGNRAGRLLALQIRKRKASNTITRIWDPGRGAFTFNPLEINEVFGAYYANLYSEPDLQPPRDAISTYLYGVGLPTVSHEQGEALVEPIMGEEVTEGIHELMTGKAADGETAEFKRPSRCLLLPFY